MRGTGARATPSLRCDIQDGRGAGVRAVLCPRATWPPVLRRAAYARGRAQRLDAPLRVSRPRCCCTVHTVRQLLWVWGAPCWQRSGGGWCSGLRPDDPDARQTRNLELEGGFALIVLALPNHTSLPDTPHTIYQNTKMAANFEVGKTGDLSVSGGHDCGARGERAQNVRLLYLLPPRSRVCRPTRLVLLVHSTAHSALTSAPLPPNRLTRSRNGLPTG